MAVAASPPPRRPVARRRDPAWLALAAACAIPAAAAQGTLVFEDDFGSLSDSLAHRWKPEITMGGGGNWEFQVYMNNRSSLYARDGVLYIKPTLLADAGIDPATADMTLDIRGSDPASLCTGDQWWGCMRTSGAGGNILPPVVSGRVRTAETFHFKYGRLEVRAKMPRGDWLWPAIWLLPRWQAYGPWPASGEIDLVESRGNAPGYAGEGVDMFGSTLHVGPHAALNMWDKFHKVHQAPAPLSDDFHVYGLEWSPTRLYTYIDSKDNVVLDVPLTSPMFERGAFAATTHNPWTGADEPNAAPFDQEYYLIMNVAVGGATTSYWPEGDGKPWARTDADAVNKFWAARGQWYPTWGNGAESSALAVDWVRVWQDEATHPGATHAGPCVLEGTCVSGAAGAGGPAARMLGSTGLARQRVQLELHLNVTRPPRTGASGGNGDGVPVNGSGRAAPAGVDRASPP